MATAPLSDDAIRDAIDRVERKLREGCRPPDVPGSGLFAIRAAADEMVRDGLINSPSTFNNRLARAKGRGVEPDWSLYRPARYQQPLPKLVLYAAPPLPREMIEPAGEGERVLVIGDLHQDPRHEDRLAVLTWIARYASEHRFGRIIQVGDWSTWDSCSNHDRNDTLKGRYKPPIKADQENLVQSHQAWRRGIADGYRPKQTITYGNHENRVERLENAQPESVGTFTGERDQTFLQFGWRTRPYGELYYVNGVAFTHHPTNAAGRPFGGKTGPQRGANETTVSIVSGHTHRFQSFSTPKIGPMDALSMVEVGCALPWGVYEAYVGPAPTGWWWGVVAMTLVDGMITDLDAVSMRTLRARYSDEGADVAA